MAMQLTSTAFAAGARIPDRYTGEGADVSPPLSWSGVPEGTKQLALICEDPDAPTPEPWVHWLVFGLPPTAKGLPEGVEKKRHPFEPVGARQGRNSWPSGQTVGYRGPMPPPGHGTHRYVFRLYALDTELDLEPGRDKEALLRAMQGHVLAEGELMGTFSR